MLRDVGEADDAPPSQRVVPGDGASAPFGADDGVLEALRRTPAQHPDVGATLGHATGR